MEGSRDLLLDFCDLLYISQKRLKLETSNLARGLITRGTSEKCKIMSNGVVKASRDLLLEF